MKRKEVNMQDFADMDDFSTLHEAADQHKFKISF